MNNSSDTIRNKTRDLLTCSAVPQPTAPPRAARRISVAVLFLYSFTFLFTLSPGFVLYLSCPLSVSLFSPYLLVFISDLR